LAPSFIHEPGEQEILAKTQDMGGLIAPSYIPLGIDTIAQFADHGQGLFSRESQVRKENHRRAWCKRQAKRR
jgi:hypothetical protein